MKAAFLAGALLACPMAVFGNCPPASESDAVISTASAAAPPSCHSAATEAAAIQTVSADAPPSSCCASEDAAGMHAVAMGDKACDGGSCDEHGATTTSGALASAMPVMTYVVGENATQCPMTAEKMAAACNGTVAYKVAGVSFDQKIDAQHAYAVELGAYLDTMTRVRFVVGGEAMSCPMTADAMCEKTGAPLQYKVGDVVFDSAAQAVRAAALAYGAAHQVTMTYRIDDKPTTCSKTAAAASKAGVKPVAFVVGAESTACPVTGSCNLVKAKIAAAQKAIHAVADKG